MSSANTNHYYRATRLPLADGFQGCNKVSKHIFKTYTQALLDCTCGSMFLPAQPTSLTLLWSLATHMSKIGHNSTSTLVKQEEGSTRLNTSQSKISLSVSETLQNQNRWPSTVYRASPYLQAQQCGGGKALYCPQLLHALPESHKYQQRVVETVYIGCILVAWGYQYGVWKLCTRWLMIMIDNCNHLLMEFHLKKHRVCELCWELFHWICVCLELFKRL